jgi:hypothetical protein
MRKETVWTPCLGRVGSLIGISLDTEFATACHQITATRDLIDRCRNYVWSITKPDNWNRGHIPSNILSFDFGTMLVSMVQYYGDTGKWLDLSRMNLPPYTYEVAVDYSMHHVDQLGDEACNRWLQFAFSRYVQFMKIQLEDQKRAGST